MKVRHACIAIAAALACGAAQSSPPARAPVADNQATRAEIDRLVQRIEVLSGQLGEHGDVQVIVRRGAHGAPLPMEQAERRRIRIDGPGHAPMAKRFGPGLGVVLAPNPAASGVRIVAVSPESPAGAAGLRADDVLISVDGKVISGSGIRAVDSARNLLGDLKQDQKVQLRYAREGKVRDATVKADSIRRVMVINRDGGARKHMGVLPPDVAMEIERIGPIARKCAAGDDDCGMPALFEAFRWQGLNLASVDASLGRYFGTSAGVLVLSSGPELKSLQSGDVIRRVNGAAVRSPREVMRELREKEAGTRLQLDVLRDRKPVPITLTVPKSRPLPFMVPPPAPAPPAAPSMPRPAHAAPPAPPAPSAAPPAPPAPPATPRRDRPGDVPGELQQATEIHVD